MALGPSLAIRGVHVLAMAVVFGGAVVAWGVFRTTAETPLRTAATYEWLFWLGAGTAVLTGVGNLGSIAPAIPRPGTPWGLAFALKLITVIGLLVGSSIRTLAVVRWSGTDQVPREVTGRFRLAYALTAGYLLVVVVLAEVLAHG